MSGLSAMSQKNFFAGCVASAIATDALWLIAVAIGAEKTLYAFQGGTDGSIPWGGLTDDHSGNLYGTTSGGGNGDGIVFRLSPKGRETALYQFLGGCDGAHPNGGVITDGAGNYYGTTSEGGNCTDEGFGTVFKLMPNGAESVLYAFAGSSSDDGDGPIGNLISDNSGDLYGVTYYGGNSGSCGDVGCGTVFEVMSSGRENLLHAFQSGSDGALPGGALVRDGNGNLYGTTEGGGGSANCGLGCGTVFEIAADGTESILHPFQGADGVGPEGPLLLDGSGNLYGTATGGGETGNGVVFKLAPDGTESVLFSFPGGSGGEGPESGVLMDKAGNFYGTTDFGGGAGCKKFGGCGTVFEVTADGREKVLYAFRNSRGRDPEGGLLRGQHGELFGTTTGGGKHNHGVVFELKK